MYVNVVNKLLRGYLFTGDYLAVIYWADQFPTIMESIIDSMQHQSYLVQFVTFYAIAVS